MRPRTGLAHPGYNIFVLGDVAEDISDSYI